MSNEQILVTASVGLYRVLHNNAILVGDDKFFVQIIFAGTENHIYAQMSRKQARHMSRNENVEVTCISIEQFEDLVANETVICN